MKKNQSIEERLQAVQVAINNSLEDADILEALNTFGYDEAKLNAGKQLQEQTDALVKKQKSEYGDQYAATKAVNDAWEASDKLYMRAVKVGRVAFKNNPNAQGSLLLLGGRKKTISGWLGQAAAFYDNLLADAELLAEMGKFGYTEAKLNEEKALLQEVSKAPIDYRTRN